MYDEIKLRRGIEANLPNLAEGELGYAEDANKLFIGTSSGNILINDNIELNDYIRKDELNAILQTEMANYSLKNHSHSLSDLSNVDITGALEGNSLAFVNGKWRPRDIQGGTGGGSTSGNPSTYLIELDRFGIKNDGTSPDETAKGINAAVWYAKNNGYKHAYLPKGNYFCKLQVYSYLNDWTRGYQAAVVNMPDEFHFEMDKEAVIELQTNSWTNYCAILFYHTTKSRVSGGVIKGDRKTHKFDVQLEVERGGINPDGSLNNDTNWIRTKPIDRLSEGIFNYFRIWKPDLLPNATGYSFAQYLDEVSSSAYINSRSDGLFAPGAPTGRGWFGNPLEANRMVVAINLGETTLTDEQISSMRIKADNGYYTHESGHAVGIFGGFINEVDHMELMDCTGDGVLTGTAYKYNVTGYPDLVELQKEMGRYVYIHHNKIHNCRRQGISLCGPNDQFVYENDIYHIGKDDDGVTPDFTAPAFGIDIESMIGESNVPAKHLYYGRDGVEVNFRIYIFNNYVHHNERGHFVNPDGTHVTVENNIFEGYNIGGVSSDPRYHFIKFKNNSYIGCEQWVNGDNEIDGGIFTNANIRLADPRGAVVRNVKIKDGMFYGSSRFGFFGQPSVDLSTSTFTFSKPHEMGNTAKVSFDEWCGKVPRGISTDKIYYVVEATIYTFKVSETEGGKPVTIYDSGESGFVLNRYDYGRVFVDGVTMERSFRSTSLQQGFAIGSTGGTFKNITLKNCNFSIHGSEYNYSGRPNILEDLTVIEGDVELNNVHLNKGNFISNYGNRISLNISANYNKYHIVDLLNCLFINQTINFGRTNVSHSKFKKSLLVKDNNLFKSVLTNSFIEDSTIESRWVTKDKVFLINNSTLFNHIIKTQGSNTNALVMNENIDITNIVVNDADSIITVNPEPAIFSSQQNVVLTSTSNNVRYTIDGTEPTTTSQLYSSAIPISSPTIIKAIAVNGEGTIVARKSWFYDVDLIAPDAVTGLSVTQTRNNSVTVKWNASASNDVISYDILNNGVYITNIKELTYTVTGLLADQSYTIGVRAVDKAGNKSDIITVVGTTSSDSTPPNEVTNILSSLIGDTYVGLTWEPSTSSDINTYQIYDGNNMIYETISAGASLTNLTPNTTYNFTIKSMDLNGNISVGVAHSVKTAVQATETNNIIKEGLIMYHKDIPSPTTVPNKNSFFTKGDFTATFVLSQTRSGEILNRMILGGNSTMLISSTNMGASNAYVFARWFGVNPVDNSQRQYQTTTDHVNLRNIIEDGAFYEITVRKQGNNLKIFLKGQENLSINPGITIDATHLLGQTNSTANLVLGHIDRPETKFKSVLYYNRALSASEISQNFNNLFKTTAPENVMDLNITSTNAGIANLTWVDPSADIYYKNVYYKLSTDTTWIKANTSRITTTNYQPTGLTSGSKYDFKVEVVDFYSNKSSGLVVNEITIA